MVKVQLEQVKKQSQQIRIFNAVYSRNDLPKIKDGAYLINIDKYKSIGTHWIALYVNGNNGSISYDVIFFDSFSWTYYKRNKTIHRKQNIITDIYRIQAYDSIMCGYFYNGFIDFMLKSKKAC